MFSSFRRSCLSAACPATKNKNTPGKNCASPTNPRSKRPPCDLVNLPPHRHRLHLQPEHNKKSRHLVKCQVRISQPSPPRKDCLRFPHAHLLCHKPDLRLEQIARGALYGCVTSRPVRPQNPASLSVVRASQFSNLQLSQSKPIYKRSHISRPKAVVDINHAHVRCAGIHHAEQGRQSFK